MDKPAPERDQIYARVNWHCEDCGVDMGYDEDNPREPGAEWRDLLSPSCECIAGDGLSTCPREDECYAVYATWCHMTGVTCQVCALDFVDDGTGILPRHTGSLEADLYD